MDGISDHRGTVLIVSYNKAKPKPAPSRKIWFYRKANVEGFRNHLHTKFSEWAASSGSVDDRWSSFKDILFEARSTFVPGKTIKENTDPPFYNATIRRLKKKCRRAYPHRKRNGNFRNLTKQLNDAKYEAYTKFIMNICDGRVNEGWKKFYSHLKRLKASSSEVPNLINANGIAMSSAKDKGDLLNDTYSRTFGPSTLSGASASYSPGDNTVGHVPFVLERIDIARAIQKVKNHSSPGPDDIPSTLLKLATGVVSSYLLVLFQICINNSIIPEEWKKAIVIPIHKGGKRDNPINYRPISLTCIICKVFEQQVCKYLRDLWTTTDFLCSSQFGFRTGYSCDASLAGFVGYITSEIDKGGQVDALLLDLSKAFDVVPHDKLMAKLTVMPRVDKRVVMWIQEYLTSRSQRVRVDGSLSSAASVNSGVPQGSVLGPLLFLVFINDFATNLNCKVRLYADDCILYQCIKSVSDCASLQNELDTACSWISSNDMRLNVDKTQCITFKLSPSNTTEFQYSIQNVDLKKSNTCKYLGVVCTSNLSWDNHIRSIVSKALRALYFVMRNLKMGTKQAREKAYTTIVRPLLEYCSPIWNPSLVTHIALLDRVQRKAARLVCRNFDAYTSNTLIQEAMKWETLSARREKALLTVMFQVITNKEAWIELQDLLTPPGRRGGRLDHPHKLGLVRFQSSVGLHSLTAEGSRMWNALRLVKIPESTHDFRLMLSDIVDRRTEDEADEGTPQYVSLEDLRVSEMKDQLIKRRLSASGDKIIVNIKLANTMFKEKKDIAKFKFLIRR